jgi:hypothetical protein
MALLIKKYEETEEMITWKDILPEELLKQDKL